jgi:hypothetical protein
LKSNLCLFFKIIDIFLKFLNYDINNINYNKKINFITHNNIFNINNINYNTNNNIFNINNNDKFKWI